MASAISNPMGVTIFPTRDTDEPDGFDEFFNSFPDAIAAQQEITVDTNDNNVSNWFLLVPKEGEKGFHWVAVENYGQVTKVPPTLVSIKK